LYSTAKEKKSVAEEFFSAKPHA